MLLLNWQDTKTHSNAVTGLDIDGDPIDHHAMEEDAHMDGSGLISVMKQYSSPTGDGDDTDIDGNSGRK